MTRTLLSRDSVLSIIDERTLFEHYFGSKIDLRKNKYVSPLRPDRNIGSCHFNYYKNRFYFFDKSSGEMIDIFSFIQRLYNCTFYESLYIINRDFKLQMHVSLDWVSAKVLKFKPLRSELSSEELKRRKSISHKQTCVEFKIIKRNWNKVDKEYWSSYRITKKTLTYFNVIPLKQYFSNTYNHSWKLQYDYNESKEPCYAYKIIHNEKLKFKLYKPTSKVKDEKWRSNMNPDILQGYDQLPEKHDILIIASSLKDVMCLYEDGVPAVAPQSESTYINDKTMTELKSRFKNIFVIFDNDNAGFEWSNVFANHYKIESLCIPWHNDVADYSKNIGSLSKVINNLVNKKLKKYYKKLYISHAKKFSKLWELQKKKLRLSA